MVSMVVVALYNHLMFELGLNKPYQIEKHFVPRVFISAVERAVDYIYLD